VTAPRKVSLLRDFQKQRYFAALDGIRAGSVLLVMSNHLHSDYPLLRRVPGWAGVDIFCVLSGFLITTLLLREDKDFGSVRLAPFYIRRFFRIVPVFLFVLLCYFPVAYFGENGLRWHAFKAALPLYLTFMQDFVPHEAPFSASWTLGIEEKFYFVWPLLAFLLLKALKSRALLAAAFFVVSSSLYLAFESSSDKAFFHARSYAALALGSMLACLLISKLAEAYSRWISSLPATALICAVILSLALIFYDRKYVLLLDLSIAIFFSHLLLVPSWARSILSSPVPVWIGKRSYSMYLIHLLIMNPIRVVIHPKSVQGELLVLLVSYAVTAGCAHLIYLWIEEPARLLGKRVIAKRQSTAQQPVAILDTSS
jgi:peptidoglycan/LPS O-acetylase OafA/YrhL